MLAKASASLKSPTLFALIFVLVLALTPLQSAHAVGVRYAKPAVSGTGDCLSWANACTLQTALTGAAFGDEIWVAAGTHKPTAGTDQNATFQLKSGVAVYGGFAGTETALSQRNPATNATILSGDLNGNDVGFTNNQENVYHVVTGASGATLDGFTVTAGNANGEECPGIGCGGGMINISSNPVLKNVTFSGNTAWVGGGGMYNRSAGPTLTDVTFSGNAGAEGGGMRNSLSGPILTNVTFSGNTSRDNAGGMLNEYTPAGYPSLTNVTFISNTAANNAGGMLNDSSSPALTNVTLVGNSAPAGGGMWNNYGNPQIRNTIFWSNSAPNPGADILNTSSAPTVTDSIVQNGCPAASICANIIVTDPKLGTLGNFGGATLTIPLLAGSSAIDTGNDAVCPPTDQRGVTRPQGDHCDIGAYEYPDTIAPNITSITRLNPSPTNLASVGFVITFTESVTGVSASDFSLAKTGTITGESVTGVSGGPAVYTVTVNTGTGSGNLRLDVPFTATITDLAGNTLAGTPFTGGASYVVDKPEPSPTPTPTATPTSTPIATPTPVSTVVSPAGGGTVTLTGAVTTTVQFPPGAVTGTVTVTISLTDTGTVSGSLAVLGQSFVIQAVGTDGQPVTQFSAPFTITVSYDDADVVGLWEADLSLYYLPEGGGAWVAIPTTVDAVRNTLTAVLDHLTRFAALAPRESRVYLPLVVRH
jgi:hypothetical protein